MMLAAMEKRDKARGKGTSIVPSARHHWPSCPAHGSAIPSHGTVEYLAPPYRYRLAGGDASFLCPERPATPRVKPNHGYQQRLL
ncbi:hypothetical protein CPLU01_04624 [Colletotrichum plurivorum]|uniref:Uncharacterized protein n=1 Tax=Colletotrichum plurivorum TaxID=2175906 RepID=A0A8H6NIK9_9PEZI|nr:hypothetical protein CPLU01_04624 [Colletotrichum plurivorum]